VGVQRDNSWSDRCWPRNNHREGPLSGSPRQPPITSSSLRYPSKQDNEPCRLDTAGTAAILLTARAPPAWKQAGNGRKEAGHRVNKAPASRCRRPRARRRQAAMSVG
jgi:hypothetical protein